MANKYIKAIKVSTKVLLLLLCYSFAHSKRFLTYFTPVAPAYYAQYSSSKTVATAMLLLGIFAHSKRSK